MYGSLTFLPPINLAVFDGWFSDISFNIACKELKSAQLTQVNQLIQLLNLARIYDHGFYELSRMLMRKNVNSDVSKDLPIEKYLDDFVIRLDCFDPTLNIHCVRNPFFPVAVWKIANYPGGDCWPARSAYSGTTGVRASTRGSHAGTETKVSRENVWYWEMMFIVIKLHRRTRKKKFEFSQQKWTQPRSCMRHVGASINLSLNKGDWLRGTALVNENRIILTWICDYQFSSWYRISTIQPRLRKLTQGFDYSEYDKSLNDLKLEIK